MIIIRRYLLIVVSIFYFTNVYALNKNTSSQIIDNIKNGVTEFLTVNFKIPNSKLIIDTIHIDRKAKLQPCDRSLQYSLPYGNILQPRMTVKISCLTENTDWSLHVSAKLKLMKTVVITTKSINASDLITRENLATTSYDVINLQRGFFEKIEDVTGKLSKRSLRLGQIVTQNNVVPPKLIKRGEMVQITAKATGLIVKMPGLALHDGYEGSKIQVKNSKTNKIVEGYIIGPGQVEILL